MCVRGGGGVNFQLFCSEWSSVNEHLPAHANLQQFLPLCSLLCHQEQTGRTSVLGQGSGQVLEGKGAQTLQDRSEAWDGGGGLGLADTSTPEAPAQPAPRETTPTQVTAHALSTYLVPGTGDSLAKM